MLPKLEKPRFMREEARTILRKAILEGQFKPGERLIEEELAERLGISRTPIREALRKLEIEGLITHSSLKGTVVVGVTGEDVIEIYGIREVLGGLAARWAVTNLTPEDVQELEALVTQMVEMIAARDMETLFALHTRFHQRTLEICHSPKLIQIATPLQDYVEKYARVAYAGSRHLERFIEEHHKIIEAFKTGDPDEAERVVRTHIAASRQVVLEALSETGGPDTVAGSSAKP